MVSPLHTELALRLLMPTHMSLEKNYTGSDVDVAEDPMIADVLELLKN